MQCDDKKTRATCYQVTIDWYNPGFDEDDWAYFANEISTIWESKGIISDCLVFVGGPLKQIQV